MKSKLSLEELWNASPSNRTNKDSNISGELPIAAQRYLNHAIAPGTVPASAVRLKMHGEIKLKKWLPFTAEQVICQERGFIWTATVRQNGLSIYGEDRMVDGQGAMDWQLMGIFPVMVASGPDITRSSTGRLQIEAVLLPSVLCDGNVKWTETDATHPTAHFSTAGEPTELNLTVEATGRLGSARLLRWGNPDGATFRYETFGGVFEDEKTFEGYTIPTNIRVGWYFGTDRFEKDGEFFRAVINSATYR